MTAAARDVEARGQGMQGSRLYAGVIAMDSGRLVCSRNSQDEEDRFFRGYVGAYEPWDRFSKTGCVVVLADDENARVAKDMGFSVEQSPESDGLSKVFCPGDQFPCWDVAHQCAGRRVYVGKDADGYSRFRLVRPRAAR